MTEIVKIATAASVANKLTKLEAMNRDDRISNIVVFPTSVKLPLLPFYYFYICVLMMCQYFARVLYLGLASIFLHWSLAAFSSIQATHSQARRHFSRHSHIRGYRVLHSHPSSNCYVKQGVLVYGFHTW
jgi:hypothetical protein